ncbi:diaminopimelate decarboxylase [Candidatus Curtissbacteria bacterium RIFCSPLOWO2_01_FULL_41_18]|uniref:Diaminopimelate decarboxylase n=2 Tax=Candidatus Curtissiibacteriota TaxID=1752717 RepID=A0A1F5FY10_9BACT|nr:MAG: diaminopimelate decarboxylase [Candidatus Curtissbacteria bacterium RIFCSPHIGHO2_01_FULL_41_13]OGE04407.1 MAG: diaminopimelate decarboxylase [Candidatus Curtissbacteria bacterium RIFCSPLOWO2_01_FULL_41_18]
MSGERIVRPATPEETAKETSLPFSREQIETIAQEYPTPFYIYDEGAIRQNARNFLETFSWAPEFRNFFAVKALPNPHILSILKDEGFGADCSSMVELEMARRVGLSGEEIMFTSNNTPADQFALAKKLGAIINLDDITHLDFLEKQVGIPSTLSFRYNPGPLREGNAIIGKPEEAKYGLTRTQLFEGYMRAKEKEVQRFGLHTMIVSNERNPEYFAETARMLFELVGELDDKVGVRIAFINLGGGVGVPHRPEHEPVDVKQISTQVQKDYQTMIVAKGLDPLQITMECGRYITGPYGYFIARVRHITEKYRDYVGVDGSITSLPRIAMYGAYHHLTVLGKEGASREMVYDVTGSLCENNDKFVTQRELPKIDPNDLVVVHEGGAHAIAMANEYNGQLLPKELLLKPDGSVLQIRRERTMDDYFSIIVNFPGFGK